MKIRLCDALAKCLDERERAGKHPELWQDNAFKSNYYMYQNILFNRLEVIDQQDILEEIRAGKLGQEP